MANAFRVRGLNPLDRFVQVVIWAPSADEARSRAMEVGLRHVLVEQVRHWSDIDALPDDEICGVDAEPMKIGSADGGSGNQASSAAGVSALITSHT